jgi:hypothetical protein
MHRRLAALVPVLALALVACATEVTDAPAAPGDLAAHTLAGSAGRRTDGKADDAVAFRSCTSDFQPAPAQSWRHLTSRVTAALASPVHGANDVVVAPGEASALDARLAYGGVLSKELEDEWVWVFLENCSSWRYLGAAKTSGEGRVSFQLPALPPGRYDVRVEVVGDGTSVPLSVWVLPAGTHVAVFDIDGTLTTSDNQLYQELLTGSTPEAYPGATDLTWAEYGRGEIVVYLTGRPEVLHAATRGWLDGLGFAPGAVHLARTATQLLPTNGGVGDYKLAFLRALTGAGVVLDDGFGNATTDVYAYAGAGLAVPHTWIIGPNAGAGGTNGVTDSWSDVAAGLANQAPVSQPFTF